MRKRGMLIQNRRDGGRVSMIQRLQWRLLFSYIAVTVVATLLIGAIVMWWLTDVLFFENQNPSNWVAHSRRTAISVARYLTSSPPDAPPLQTWIDDARKSVRRAGVERSPVEDEGPLVTLQWSINPKPRNIAIVVVDSGGAIVAGEAIAGIDPGLRLAPLIDERERPLLANALAGDVDDRRLGITDKVGVVSAAAPIRGTDGHVIGAVFERVRTTVDFPNWLIGSGALVLLATAFMAFVASILGSIFSYVTSRGMTSRLEVIAEAAEAWSRGDFTPQARETPRDELGDLGRRLNEMSREVAEMLVLKQRLARSEERNRLARDLHDTVKQQAFAAAMQLGAARHRHPEDTAIDEAAKIVAGMQQELRSMLRELSDDNAPVDVGVVLSERVATWSRRTGIDAEFSGSEVSPLPSSAAAAVLAITEEALSNVARHSGASSAEVTFAEDEQGHLSLSVEDNGRGIDGLDGSLAPANAGMGLRNLRERAEALPNGRFVIESTPNAGVRVSIGFSRGEDETNGR